MCVIFLDSRNIKYTFQSCIFLLIVISEFSTNPPINIQNNWTTFTPSYTTDIIAYSTVVLKPSKSHCIQILMYNKISNCWLDQLT